MPSPLIKDGAFVHTFPNGEIRKYTPEEVDVAYMLTFCQKFGTFPSKEQIPPGSELTHFDKELALAVAKRKRDDGEEDRQISSPNKAPPVTLDELFICDICGDELAVKSTLKRHKQNHDESTKIFSCGVCNKLNTRQRTNWKQHVTTHIGQKIPPEVFNRLDDATKALINAEDKYVTDEMLQKRLIIAEARNKRLKVR